MSSGEVRKGEEKREGRVREEVLKILHELAREAGGQVNVALCARRDGLPISWLAPSRVEAEFMSVAVAAAVGALEGLGDVVGSKVKRIDIELSNGRHVIISVLNDRGLLAIGTSPRPNLGLIHLITRKYEEKLQGTIDVETEGR